MKPKKVCLAGDIFVVGLLKEGELNLKYSSRESL